MLQKQAVPISFAGGIDNKTDPFQIDLGKFLALDNSVFTIGKRLTKRNGYTSLTPLPTDSSYLTTFNGDLTAISTQIEAYSLGSTSWVSKGQFQPLTTSVLPIIRNNLNQTQADSVIAPNGFVCTVYTELNNTTKTYKYVVADSVTGQNIIAPTTITSADATLGTPRVFLTTQNFIIIFTNLVTATYHLKFIAVSIANPSVATAAADISTSYTPSARLAFDAVVINGSVYVAWNGAAASGIKMAYISPSLVVSSTVVEDAAHEATIVSVCSDVSHSIIWVSYYNSGSSTGYSLAVDTQLNLQTNFPTQIIASGTILNISSAAQSGICTVFYETSHTDNGIQTNFVSSVTVIQSTGVVSSPIVVLRSVGVASKAFIIDSIIYFLAVYSSTYQPTYFLVNGSLSTSASPVLLAKLAYENGAGYLATGTPSALVSGSTVSIAYLFKDLIQALSDSNSDGTAVTGGVYSQTGINLASFQLGSQGLVTSEIGTNLNISGGFLWAYDGYSLTEQGFHLWPDSVQVSTTTGAGGLIAQQYFYVVTYEWTDNQGNAFRSAPSIPVGQITTTGSSTNTLIIPTLRITQKIDNPVKIVVYRWSTAQQTFFQTTSIIAPVLNSTTVDSVTVTDTNADAAIAGNNILYTTGGVIEDTGAPACSAMTLFDDRLWIVDSEDPNLLWFSKQVIEATPVEMSDLLTLFVAPSIGAQGPSGPIKALSAMDDKLIIFKGDRPAIYYINGTGPDNTGANNQYSQPTFITSMVGCSNQNSIVFQPQGLMFEFASEVGNQIWLLGRDLSTRYIGAPVEALTLNATVLSSVAVPGTNQVRFNLSSGITLMYDYFYEQWGTFSNNGVSSTVYQGLHTYISPNGSVFQESPGKYLDGSNPVLLSLTTAWINLAGLQGYQRAYFFYLLGQYFTPFKLQCSIAYDYLDGPTQTSIIAPTNFSPAYGSAESNGQLTVYGNDNPYGGNGNVLNWRVFLSKQRCSAFKITIQEFYDPSLGVAPGEGLNLSGINLVCALKKGFIPISAAHSVGGGS